jgi:hypothetical protein
MAVVGPMADVASQNVAMTKRHAREKKDVATSEEDTDTAPRVTLRTKRLFFPVLKNREVGLGVIEMVFSQTF